MAEFHEENHWSIMKPPGNLSDPSVPRPLSSRNQEPWGSFLKTMAWIGLNSFGGPVAQIGFMHKVAVEQRRWLTDGQFVNVLNFANVLPGPEALEISIHLGYLRRGLWGGIAAGLLFIWPGFVSLTALAWVYQAYGRVNAIAGFIDGIRPVAIALVVAAAVRISRKAIRGNLSYILMMAAFLASFVLNVPFIAILVGGGLLGLWLGRYQKDRPDSHSKLPGWCFLLGVVLLVGMHSWIVPRGVGDPLAGQPVQPAGAKSSPAPEVTGDRLAKVAWINTKAALVTFGGAYTMLPYLREQMVQRTAWLTDRHMIDALALGETTPGPLISFGIFLSYLVAGFPGAVVGCVFLFLPSFILVLSLGRYAEKVEGLPHARDILWGFSAGTLGLIIALAADLVPQSLPNVFSALLAAAAFVAVWRFDLNLVLVVLTGGAIGLAHAYAPFL